jgi:hypothetical protein
MGAPPCSGCLYYRPTGNDRGGPLSLKGQTSDMHADFSCYVSARSSVCCECGQRASLWTFPVGGSPSRDSRAYCSTLCSDAARQRQFTARAREALRLSGFAV